MKRTVIQCMDYSTVIYRKIYCIVIAGMNKIHIFKLIHDRLDGIVSKYIIKNIGSIWTRQFGEICEVA